MSEASETTFDSLRAPSEDGGLLIQPSADQWPRLIEENRGRLSKSILLLGESVQTWRDGGSDSPRIVTGHQPSFYHAGVWVKHAAAGEFARRLGGVCEFLVVDSDLSHGVRLAWPEWVDGYCRTREFIARAGDQGLAYEQLAICDDDAWRIFFAPIAGQSDCVTLFVDGFTGSRGCRVGYVARWVEAMRACDRRLGIQGMTYDTIGRRFSWTTSSITAAALTAHMLLAANELRSIYNESLAEYRRRRRIIGIRHPVPDLEQNADAVELPFWLLKGQTPRQRLFVVRRGDDIEVLAGTVRVGVLGVRRLASDPCGELARGLGESCIRPRALMLTLFTRLMECDFFIHGIGGAAYDQITDAIIRRLFHATPPHYASVSATLRLDLTTHDVDEERIRRYQLALRDVRFNPQRVVRESLNEAVWLRREAAILESGRLREKEPGNRSARRRVFEAIRQANAELIGDEAREMLNARLSLETARQKWASNLVARSREWFFALHDSKRLETLHDRIGRAMS